MSGQVAVAMSGGLDSSVAAWLLTRSGEAMAGLSMLLWDRPNRDAHGRCCGALDLVDARRVAGQCGIPHYTVPLEEVFRENVVDPFVAEYLAGRTPNPCARCNAWVKFGPLLDKARAIGAERLATGHYARVLEGVAGPELHRASCAEKDQSYYLFELSRDQLARTLFPLGEMTKDEVRSIAREAGLVVAGKGDSMEVCFVAGDVGEFVAEQTRLRPERFGQPVRQGARIVDRQGRELGRGGPYYRYTVGQRRGLGLAARERLYVLDVDARCNELVVGTRQDLACGGLRADGCHWIGRPRHEAFEADVRIRARHQGVRSLIEPRADGSISVEFEVPQIGVTPGQAAVFYDGSRVLGGCWIEGALSTS